MIKLIGQVLTSALLVLTPAVASAQMDALKNSTPQERAEMQTKWMQTNLSLDAKSADAVSAINLKYAQKNQVLMDSGSPRFEKMTSMMRNADAKDAELKAVLTSEQYGLYEQKKSELRQKLESAIQEKHQAGQ